MTDVTTDIDDLELALGCGAWTTRWTCRRWIRAREAALMAAFDAVDRRSVAPRRSRSDALGDGGTCDRGNAADRGRARPGSGRAPRNPYKVEIRLCTSLFPPPPSVASRSNRSRRTSSSWFLGPPRSPRWKAGAGADGRAGVDAAVARRHAAGGTRQARMRADLIVRGRGVADTRRSPCRLNQNSLNHRARPLGRAC